MESAPMLPSAESETGQSRQRVTGREKQVSTAGETRTGRKHE